MKKLENTESLGTSFENIISLGFFCNVAGELETYGLRSASYPFDWIISSFEGVLQCMEDGFKDFLNIAYLSQSAIDRTHYKNSKYNCYFFHDFDKYKSLRKQLARVTKKYQRRENRFFETIKSPTLFIRYISDELKDENGKSMELTWIEQNMDKIEQTLRKFNPNNRIMFIANEGVVSDTITIHNIAPDDNDVVARKWVSKNEYLLNYFSTFDYPEKEANLLRLQQKDKKNRNIVRRAYKKFARIYKETLLKEYIHEIQYDIPDNTVAPQATNS